MRKQWGHQSLGMEVWRPCLWDLGQVISRLNFSSLPVINAAICGCVECAHLQGMQIMSFIRLGAVVFNDLERWQVRKPASLVATSTGHATCSQNPGVCLESQSFILNLPLPSQSPEAAITVSRGCIQSQKYLYYLLLQQSYYTQSHCRRITSS